MRIFFEYFHCVFFILCNLCVFFILCVFLCIAYFDCNRVHFFYLDALKIYNKKLKVIFLLFLFNCILFFCYYDYYYRQKNTQKGFNCLLFYI